MAKFCITCISKSENGLDMHVSRNKIERKGKNKITEITSSFDHNWLFLINNSWSLF